jgi:hypothetical protein
MKFQSRKNTVELLDSGVVRKTFWSSDACAREAEVLNKLDGRRAPRLLFYGCPVIETEYIKGELLLNKYLTANEIAAKNLASALALTVEEIHRLTGQITFDENFRNYIITQSGTCVRIDFEETTAGPLTEYAAKIAAFAALYDVAESVKLAFINSLAASLKIDKPSFCRAFQTELIFLSNRWGVPFPKSFFENYTKT